VFDMKKINLLTVLVLGLMATSAMAMGGPAPEKAPVTAVVLSDQFLIDDFESGSLKSPRDWWTFDIAEGKAAPNAELTLGGEEVAGGVGKYSFQLKGDATNWYAGGAGTYLAKEGQNLSKFNYFVVDIYGNGPGSGSLKVELGDDDNRNWQIEQNKAKNYVPLYDDKFVYEIPIDWKGWQRVSIALDDFVDDNPGVGDDIWNPTQKDDSGGMLQLQFVCLAVKDKGIVNFNIDNIKLTVDEE
jgi:hypothetical protein